MNGYLYLASPYSHAEPSVRFERYWQAVLAAAKLMKEGHCVFSPIAHTHEIGVVLGDAVNHSFWMRQDRELLRHAVKLVVLTLPGWDQSKGIAEEIQIANALGMPVEYVEP